MFDDWSVVTENLHRIKSKLESVRAVCDLSTVDCGCHKRDTNYLPAFYVGHFKPEVDTDLFLDVRPCGKKGLAFVNGHNLGRYWPGMGPQVTLYVPRPFLVSGVNTLVLFELERDRRNTMLVNLTNRHIINGTTPDNYQESQTRFGQFVKSFD